MTEAERSPELAIPGAVEPCFFGASRLFGCVQAKGEPRAVVICQPFGYEYLTLHRALRQLATRIARRGIGVLRFDYSGTGDSPGRLLDARLAAWRDEIGQAIDEIRRSTGAERVGLVGVRLGAALALAAARERGDVAALALWDPVVWGRTYLSELRHTERRMRRRAHVTADPEPTDAAGRDEYREILGFPISRPLEDDIRAIELDRESPPHVEHVLLLESRPAVAAPLGAALRSAGLAVESELEPHPGLWSWKEDITKVELPHGSVRRLEAWISEALR